MAVSLPFLAVLGAALTLAAYTDVRWRRVPNPLAVAVALTGLVSQAWRGGLWAVGSGLLAAIIVFALLWLAWTRRRIGGGDLKLATAAAIWVGMGQLPAYLLSGAVAGGVLSVACYATSSREARLQMRANLSAVGLGAPLPEVKATGGRSSVPYALAVAAGVAVALVRGG